MSRHCEACARHSRASSRRTSDARNFSFTMPPDGDGAAFPLTFGLTADIGQTVVSKLNAEWLLSQLSDAEPYAARNSSDGAAQIAAQIL